MGVQKVQKPVEVVVIETVEKIVDVPVVKQIEVPQIQTIEKIVEVPFVQTVEKIVEIPTVGNTVTGEQRSVNIQLETVRQIAPAEAVEEIVAGPPMPTETAQPILRGVQQQMGAPVATMTQQQVVMEPVVGGASMQMAAPAMTVIGGASAQMQVQQGASASMALPTTYGAPVTTMAPVTQG